MVWCSLNDITVCKWKDKREVLTISNAHQAEMVSVSNRRGKEKMKPNIVKDYNEAMSRFRDHVRDFPNKCVLSVQNICTTKRSNGDK